jgi:hypothetical protein
MAKDRYKFFLAVHGPKGERVLFHKVIEWDQIPRKDDHVQVIPRSMALVTNVIWDLIGKTVGVFADVSFGEERFDEALRYLKKNGWKSAPPE